MKTLARIILHVVANAAALFLAARYIEGVTVTGDPWMLLGIGAALTLLNLLLKPVLKLILGPFIFLTAGLFIVVVNALILKLLDFSTPDLTIQGYLPLLYATLLVGLVNVVFGIGGKVFGIDK